jgi:hypothetical protein
MSQISTASILVCNLNGVIKAAASLAQEAVRCADLLLYFWIKKAPQAALNIIILFDRR